MGLVDAKNPLLICPKNLSEFHLSSGLRSEPGECWTRNQSIFLVKKKGQGQMFQAVTKAFLEELGDRIGECVIVLVSKASFSWIIIDDADVKAYINPFDIWRKLRKKVIRYCHVFNECKNQVKQARDCHLMMCLFQLIIFFSQTKSKLKALNWRATEHGIFGPVVSQQWWGIHLSAPLGNTIINTISDS